MGYKNGPNWKGGVTVSGGYTYIWKPGYHRRKGKSNYAKVADITLEQKLGRLLTKNEIAHHINGIRSDDNPNNLEAKDWIQHIAEHLVENVKKAQENRPKCPICGVNVKFFIVEHKRRHLSFCFQHLPEEAKDFIRKGFRHRRTSKV